MLNPANSRAMSTPDGEAASSGSQPNEVRRVAVPASLRPANVLVTVESASGLAAHDKNGLSDPFVRVTYAGRKQKTATVRKTLEPRWQQALLFDAFDASCTTVHFEVIDHDTLVPDDFIGSCDVDVRPLADDTPVDGTFELRDKAGGAAGKLTVRIKRGHWTREQVDTINKPV